MKRKPETIEAQTIKPEVQEIIEKFTNLVTEVLQGKLTGKATKAVLGPYKTTFERNEFDRENIKRVATSSVIDNHELENPTTEELETIISIKKALKSQLFKVIVFKIIKRKVNKKSEAKSLEELLIEEIKNNSSSEISQEELEQRTGEVLTKIWENIENQI